MVTARLEKEYKPMVTADISSAGEKTKFFSHNHSFALTGF